MKTLAIIPARSGSKRLESKNIKDLCGKPLIYYQIKNAFESKEIDNVVLASDSMEFLKIGHELFGEKLITILRPEEISTEWSKIEETLLYVLDYLPSDYNIAVTLEPTSPLNTPKHIDQCVMRLKSSDRDAVCCTVHDYSFQLNTQEDYLHVFSRPIHKAISPRIKEVRNCWATYVDALRYCNNRLGEHFDTILIPEIDSFSISTEEDLVAVNAIMKHRNKLQV